METIVFILLILCSIQSYKHLTEYVSVVEANALNKKGLVIDTYKLVFVVTTAAMWSWAFIEVNI